MKSDWGSIYLKDICDYKTGRLNSNAAIENGVYPFFTCSPDTYKINDYAFDQDAVILGGNNANGKFPLKKYKGKFNAYQRTYVMASKNENIINNNYLYYYLSYKLNYLQNLSIGSATKFLTKTILDALKINYPKDSKKMNRIGLVLSQLDSKIETNKDIINNLENISQTLFKRWFIDFEFPNEEGLPYKSSGGKMVGSELGEIPDSWNVKEIGEALELAYGKPLKKDERINGNIPVYGSNGIVDYHNEALVTGPGIVVGRKGTIGTVKYEYKDFYPIDTTFYVVPKENKYSLIYLNYILLNQKLPNLGSDSAVPGLNRNNAYKSKFVDATENIIDKFNEIVEPMFKNIDSLLDENQKLEKIRNSLLPKLLSGEIEIPDESVVD